MRTQVLSGETRLRTPSLIVGLVRSVCLFGVLASMGCTHVKPYERSKLAHPTMVTDDLAGPAEQHMRSVQEGAAGGGGGGESGCGCN